jgi:hypothetical protein
MNINHADSLTFVSALGVSEPADAGKGVGRENRDSCEREMMSESTSRISRVQRTSRALPKQGAHMIQMSCVWEVVLRLAKNRGAF